MSTETGIGASVLRKEDARFITGKGQYTDDISVFGQTHCVFVRSPHARAKINGINTDAAMAIDGVIRVFTGDELVQDGIGDLPCGWVVNSKDGTPMVSPPHPPVATSVVNYVGEPYAFVIAETLQAARDGAEAVEADFEVLEAVVDTATASSSVQIHENAPNNQAYDWELGDKEATDASFAKADHVTTLDITNNRLIPNAIEPRAALGSYGRRIKYVHALHDITEPPCRTGRSSVVCKRRTRSKSSRNFTRRWWRFRLEDLRLRRRDSGHLGIRKSRQTHQVACRSD